ncbi:9020_t:CDS:10 [Entrophospora sp. SA101]|nr:9020_t:CDS:10 [Entrophospora sp. SA101]
MTSCLKWENFSKDPANSTYHYSKLAKIVIEDRVNKPNKEDFQKIGFEEKENDPVIIITNKEENDNNRNENHHGVYQDDNDENQFQKKLVVKKGWIATDKFNRVYGVYQIVIALQSMVGAIVLRAVHNIGEHSFILHKSSKFNWWLFSFAVLGVFQSVLRMNYLVTLVICELAFMFIDRNYHVLGVCVDFRGIGLPSLQSLGVGVAKTTDPAIFLVWMTKQTFLDAIAIGNVFPSSLVMFSTFIGYKGGYVYGGVGYGFLGVVLITIGIFTPCFLFTILGHDLLKKLFGTIPAGTERDLVAAKQSSLAAVIYILTLGILYKFRKPLTSLLLVIFGAIIGSAKSSGSDIVTLRKKRRRGGCNEELKLLLDLEPSPNSVTAIY